MNTKNIVFIATSLDGFIAGKQGELDWLEMIPNPNKEDMGYRDLMQEIDAIVMGRNTYETVCGFGGDWPYTKQVFVLSHSIKAIPQKLADKVTLLAGSPSEVLDKIHNKGYSKLYIDGGKTVQNFLEKDLIDELRITTIPILLGGGFSLFGDLANRLEFEHITSKLFLNQVVQNHYKRKR